MWPLYFHKMTKECDRRIERRINERVRSVRRQWGYWRRRGQARKENWGQAVAELGSV